MQCCVQGYHVHAVSTMHGLEVPRLYTYVLPQQRKGPSEDQETYYEEI